MLKYLRTHTKTIVWIVVISFCLWGGYAFKTSTQKAGRIAGELFGKDVSYRDFDLFFKANQFFSFAGKKPPEDANILHAQTWQTLIFAYEAKQQKILITDEEVRNEIKRLLGTLKIENPTDDFYKRWLASSFRLSPQEFERMVREILAIQKLVTQFNDAPLPEPAPEMVQQRFKREENSLSLKLVSFPTEAQAKTFHQEVAAHPEKFDALVTGQKLSVQSTGKVALDAILNLWQIPENIANLMLAAKPNEVSEPFSYVGQYAVAKLIEKSVVDPAKWNDETKNKIAERLKNQSKYERFANWMQSLQTRANMKDYTPQGEQLKETPPAAPQEVTAQTVDAAKAAASAAAKATSSSKDSARSEKPVAKDTAKTPV